MSQSTPAIATSDLAPRLIRFASITAGIAILIAPFRASAGLRGAMLVLAGLAIVFAYWRAGQFSQLLLPYKALVVATGVWLLSAVAWSFVSPSPLESLSVDGRVALAADNDHVFEPQHRSLGENVDGRRLQALANSLFGLELTKLPCRHRRIRDLSDDPSALEPVHFHDCRTLSSNNGSSTNRQRPTCD